ncbi:fumarylacetoacetate hydrolase family protein [Subtercola sp. YIM 133946]|uniref:fumarylacetoacetate hydrolase family protein n=1 Tax=Subtercola sp. YIM 133946 TaxID=3118909 RepID=UPI002F92CDB6
MRFVKYRYEGADRLGLRVDETRVVDTGFSDLRQYLRASEPEQAAVAALVETATAVVPERLLAPLADRCQIIYAGGNYANHLAEVAHLITPVEPVFFPGLWSSVIGPGDAIVIPEQRTATDYEAELTFVISKTAKNVAAADAWQYVFGYTMINDVSARDVMQRESLQIMLCKSPDTFCPVGPDIVTADEVGEIGGRRITTTVNGVLKQDATTDMMVVRIPELIEFLTRTVTLSPGDVVTTGTPGGVGAFRTPPEFMKPGDVVTVAVEGVGELTNPLVAGWASGADAVDAVSTGTGVAPGATPAAEAAGDVGPAAGAASELAGAA